MCVALVVVKLGVDMGISMMLSMGGVWLVAAWGMLVSDMSLHLHPTSPPPD